MGRLEWITLYPGSPTPSPTGPVFRRSLGEVMGDRASKELAITRAAREARVAAIRVTAAGEGGSPQTN